jgi:L-amino acid N-acyltransferase YncA
MSATIHFNHERDGDWVMTRVGGVFNAKTDHVIALHRDGRICGGVVYTGYLGASIMVHMAGNETNWATPDFLWVIFDYAFNQLGVRKLIGLVPANNSRAISIDIRLGFRIEAKLTEMMVDGSDLLILSMRKSEAKWLRYTPRHYRSNLANLEVK